MNRVGLALLCVVGLTGPAAAQQDPALCTRIVDAVSAATGAEIPAASVTAEGADCVLTDLTIPDDGSYGIALTVDRLAWRGSDLAVLEDLLLPAEIDVVVQGLRIRPRTPDPVFRYLLAAQAGPYGIDATASLRWDSLTNVLRLIALDIDFPGDDALSLTATVTGADLSSHAAMQTSLGNAVLTQMSLDVTMQGLFERYLLIPLGQRLLKGSTTPEQSVAGLKATATDLIAALPDEAAGAESREALTRLVADLPNPRGRVMLSVDAPEGLGARTGLAFAVGWPTGSIEDLAALIGRVVAPARIAIGYRQEPE